MSSEGGNESTTERNRRRKYQDNVKPGSQDTIAEIDCSIEKSTKTFIHENLETDGNTDSSGKTGNSKSILEFEEVKQMAEMTKFITHIDEESDK